MARRMALWLGRWMVVNISRALQDEWWRSRLPLRLSCICTFRLLRTVWYYLVAIHHSHIVNKIYLHPTSPRESIAFSLSSSREWIAQNKQVLDFPRPTARRATETPNSELRLGLPTFVHIKTTLKPHLSITLMFTKTAPTLSISSKLKYPEPRKLWVLSSDK